jgi:integral membrane protein MviN
LSARLLRSTGVVGVFTLGSRVLGFIRDVLNASLFGAGAGMDAFLVAFRIPNLMRRLFAEGAFSQAFVPVFTEARHQRSEAELRHLVDVVAGTLGGILAMVTVVGVIGAPLLLMVFAPGFGAEPGKFALGTHLLRITFPYLLLISLTALMAGILNSTGRFAVPAATPMLLNVCMIAAVLVNSHSIEVLAWAVLAGGAAQLLFQLPSVARIGLMPRPRWGWSDPDVRRILRLMLPILFGSSVGQISLLLDTVIASLMGTGPVSWLYFADRIMEFPLGLFSIALGTVILPHLSGQHARRSLAAFSDTLDWGLRLILLIALPAAVGLFLLAGPLVSTCSSTTASPSTMCAWRAGR